MNCKVNCSFGEIIDKYTILNLKKINTDDVNKLRNINNEINLLKQDNPLVDTENFLFNELYNVNSKLWELEDFVRYKSSIKSFDEEYINCTESIHINNDLRAEIKRKINKEFNSFLIEEKIYEDYSLKKRNSLKREARLELGKKHYINGNFKDSLEIIETLIDESNLEINTINKTDTTDFLVDLIFSYLNICNIYNIKFPYFYKIKYIVDNISQINISQELKEHCKFHYCITCLELRYYELAYPYLNYFNSVTNNFVNKNTISFFNSNDIGKTLLVYDGGGIGDIIMFARFIPELSGKYFSNNIILLVNKSVFWLFEKVFGNYKNLKLVSEDKPNIGRFDYHCNISCLIKYLSIKPSNLDFFPLFSDLNLPINTCIYDIIQEIKAAKKLSKKTFVFNWKGNPKCSHEKFNRGMDLTHAIPLFQITNIDWIVVTKNISLEEKNILKENNVKYCDNIDNHYSFLDTMVLFENVDGVITTDTSLLHIAANLNVKTYAMLTLGCEWRWAGDKSIWYPDVYLVKQKTQGDWTDVIRKIKNLILLPEELIIS